MSDAVLNRLSSILVDLVPKPSLFRDSSNYEPGQGWVQIGEFPDLVERAGYRTVEQQVREMVLAGERLADWRSAVYPDVVVNGLEAVPVFLDQIEILDRFKTLQDQRAKRKASEEAAKAAAEAPKPEPAPVLVKVVADPVQAKPDSDGGGSAASKGSGGV